MSIITISRGSYSHGKAVAERVARELGYECIARDILLQASKEYNVPEIMLYQAIQGTPSILERILKSRSKYVHYIQAALLKQCRNDNVVYQGFAGHFFLKDIPHVLKVRIIAEMEQRIQLVMDRDGVSRKEAVRFIHKLDDQRRKWGLQLYGIDTADPGLYDLVINISRISVEDAAHLIVHTVGMEQFRTTPESQKRLEDLALAAEVKASLLDVKPEVEVQAHRGLVTIRTKQSVSLDWQRNVRERIDQIAEVLEVVFEIP
jgi:cytidylate kinase